MRRTNWWRLAAVAAMAMAASSVPLAMQGALAALGLTEATARALVLAEVQDAGRSGNGGKLRTAGMAAYGKVPEAARGQVTAALFAWTKAFVNTPVFAAAYAKTRATTMPVRQTYERTIDEELSRKLADDLAGLDNMKAAAATMPPAEREKFLTSLKQTADSLRAPEMQKMQRAALEAERAQKKATDDALVGDWDMRYPADPQVMFARRLREFLEATADVDFSARQTPMRDLAGNVVGFPLSPAYEKKPWQWLDALAVGPDATETARSAATAWLKEIGK